MPEGGETGRGRRLVEWGRVLGRLGVGAFRSAGTWRVSGGVVPSAGVNAVVSKQVGLKATAALPLGEAAATRRPRGALPRRRLLRPKRNR